MAQVAVVLAGPFQERPFRRLRDALIEAGHTVEYLGAEAGRTVEGDRGLALTLQARVDDARPSDFDAVVLPDQKHFELRRHRRLEAFVRDVYAQAKPVVMLHEHGWTAAGLPARSGAVFVTWPTVKGVLFAETAPSFGWEGLARSQGRGDDDDALAELLLGALGPPVPRLERPAAAPLETPLPGGVP